MPVFRLVSMSQVTLYEVEFATNLAVAANGWRSQTIRGTDVPAPRLDFCLITASAPDNSSFNIYMYGGMTTLPVCLYIPRRLS